MLLAGGQEATPLRLINSKESEWLAEEERVAVEPRKEKCRTQKREPGEAMADGMKAHQC